MDALLQMKAEQLALEMAEQVRTPADVQAVMRLMMKSVMERVLDVELDHHLGRHPLAASLDGPATAATEATIPPATENPPPKRRNRRNGRTPKTVRADLGEITIATPRDREGTFEPLLIPKHQRQVTGFEEKILALYAKGMSTRDIQEILQDLYGVEVSATLISDATAAIDAEVSAWRSRPIISVWPIVYFDGIVVHVRGANSRVSQHTIYVALGVNLEGKKESAGPLALGKRRGQVLALGADRPEEPRPERHLRGLHRRFGRLWRRDPRSVRECEGATLCRASGACRAAVCRRSGQQSRDPRSQEDLQRSHIGGCRAGT